MSTFRFLASAFVLTGAFAACGDTSAPSSPDVAGLPSLSVTGDGVAQHVLRHRALAPALETYEVSFWAFAGKNRSIEIRYQNGLPNAGVGDRFLRFTVPNGGLVTDLTGRRMKGGDSLLITVRLDPTDFTVDFEPSGLAFARKAPAQLEFWYGNADPDVNRDGVVDASDAEIMASALGVFHYDKKGDLIWTPITASNDNASKTISAEIDGFSGYAVSW